MKLHSEGDERLLRVQAYDGGSVTVAQQRITSSFAITPQAVLPGVAVSDVRRLRWAQLAVLHDQDIEILILGTGASQHFPGGELYAELAAARIGLEVMDTPAACRTYNILASEGRRVAAVILLGDVPA